MMGLPAGTRIWIAAGVTDMRAGSNGLAAKVEIALTDTDGSKIKTGALVVGIKKPALGGPFLPLRDLLILLTYDAIRQSQEGQGQTGRCWRALGHSSFGLMPMCH